MSGNSSETTAAWINHRTAEHVHADPVTLRPPESAPTPSDKCTFVRHPYKTPPIRVADGLMAGRFGGSSPGGRWSGREAVFRWGIRLQQHLKMIILLPTPSAHTSPLKGCWLFKRRTEPDVPETKRGVPFHFLALLLFLASAAGR